MAINKLISSIFHILFVEIASVNVFFFFVNLIISLRCRLISVSYCLELLPVVVNPFSEDCQISRVSILN
jgi:hypothetical protein